MTAMMVCVSPLRLTVFRSATLPPSRVRVLSTASVYSRSICCACDCTCDANSELSAAISTTRPSVRRTCSTRPVSSSTSAFPSEDSDRCCCCCCWGRPWSPSPPPPPSPSRSLSPSPECVYDVEAATPSAVPVEAEDASILRCVDGGGGGVRRRRCSASASTFRKRTSRHWSNDAATRCSSSVTMSTTPCKCAIPCGPSRRPAAVSSTVARSSAMCAWHALTLSRTSLSMPSRTPSESPPSRR
mmetsp:Transcript_32727/g.82515  ORF Transcript_32727/g.82515 Transcript_32727/m.82515 type:complete len:243 (+) Transcript_32727:273-1001(+)